MKLVTRSLKPVALLMTGNVGLSFTSVFLRNGVSVQERPKQNMCNVIKVHELMNWTEAFMCLCARDYLRAQGTNSPSRYQQQHKIRLRRSLTNWKVRESHESVQTPVPQMPEPYRGCRSCSLICCICLPQQVCLHSSSLKRCNVNDCRRECACRWC